MKYFAFVAASCAMILASCDQPQRGTDAEDNSNPFFRQAIKYASEQNYNAAIKKYEDALRANPTVARAHKEMGILYSEKLGDAVSGIYHFQRYLQARPDAPDRDQIQTLIDKAKIDFVLTLPNSPMQNAEEMAKISKENVELKQALAQAQMKLAKTDAVIAQVKAGQPVDSEALKAVDNAKIATPTEAQPSSAEALAQPASQQPVQATAVRPQASVAAPSTGSPASMRKHVIAKGESLWKIAKQYYPPDQITEGITKIKQANPEATSNERNLKLGQELIIP